MCHRECVARGQLKRVIPFFHHVGFKTGLGSLDLAAVIFIHGGILLAPFLIILLLCSSTQTLQATFELPQKISPSSVPHFSSLSYSSVYVCAREMNVCFSDMYMCHVCM